MPIKKTEKNIAIASQQELIWWRFKKHKLGFFSGIFLICLYVSTIFTGFFSVQDPHLPEAFYVQMPPRKIHLFDDGKLSPYIYNIEYERDPKTLRRIFTENKDEKIPIRFFVKGFKYKFLGIFSSDIHFIGIDGDSPQVLFLLGADALGRDLLSRMLYGAQISLSIGLLGVFLSLVLGLILGGISGFFGGIVDTIIQRAIEIIRSIPTIPLWMGLAAALPRDWSVVKMYFAITVILSLVGWTGLARMVRGKILAVRNEDYVTAAVVCGAKNYRIIFWHILPAFYSHIIAEVTLALPKMIISETSLSFLGLGMRAPAISWGTLLQSAQNLQSLAHAPWLLIPAIPVILTILAMNFMGDALRDASDPYS